MLDFLKVLIMPDVTSDGQRYDPRYLFKSKDRWATFENTLIDFEEISENNPDAEFPEVVKQFKQKEKARLKGASPLYLLGYLLSWFDVFFYCIGSMLAMTSVAVMAVIWIPFFFVDMFYDLSSLGLYDFWINMITTGLWYILLIFISMPIYWLTMKWWFPKLRLEYENGYEEKRQARFY